VHAIIVALSVFDSPARASATGPGIRWVAPSGCFAAGRAKIAQKVGEEAVETVIAALGDNKAALISEATDLMFHLLVLLADAGLSLDDIRAEMQRREGVSGIDEKAARAD
jgi:phosphoribosyl-ATP pyrophosphohydrolase